MASQHNLSSTELGGKNFIPGIAWFLFVAVLVCIPGEDLPSAPYLDIISFDKMVHAALFGGIVFFFCMAFKKSVISRQEKLAFFIKIAMATCVWGITTELIQKYFIPGRQFDWFDWAADSFGALVAFFVSVFFFAKANQPSIAEEK
jgi:VanZ family protein